MERPSAAGGRRRRQSRGIAIDGARLRQARLDAGLTLADVAGDAMSKQAVHLFETGSARPTLAKLRVILERIGVSLDAVRADRDDDHEVRMAALDDRQDHDQLERVARRVLRDRTASPRAKALANYYAARATVYTAPRSALHRARTAGKQLRRLGERALAAEALDCEAAALYMLQDSAALHVAQLAVAEYRELADRKPRVEARMLSNLASYLLRVGRKTEAIGTYRDALDVAGSVLDLAQLARIYHGLGSAYMDTGRMREAFDHLDRAVQLCRTEHDLKGAVGARLARLENDYGVYLMHHAQLARAEEMLHASLEHYAESGVDAERAHTLLSMGELAQVRGDMDEAMEWTGQAIDLAEQRSEVIALATGYQQLGELCAAVDQRDRCDAYFHRAIEILEAAGERQRRAECVARYRQLIEAARSDCPPGG